MKRYLSITGVAAVVMAVLVLCSCGNSSVKTNAGHGDTIRLRHARLLTMVRYADHIHVAIKDPWQKDRLLQSFDIRKPYRRMAVFTSPHCQLLCDIGAEKVIGAVADTQYMVMPALKQAVRRGRVADAGQSLQPNIERLAAAHCDAIIVSPFQNSGGFGRLEKLGIPVIQAADYMESTALGRAEWMKLYGVLCGREREADSLFAMVEQNYRKLKAFAAKQPRGRQILTERKTGGTWYVPGGQSTMATIIADANGGYAFADDRHAGSLALKPEQIIMQAGNADVWAFKVSGPNMLTEKALLAEYSGYGQLKAMRTGEIYECLSTVTPYFEEVAFHPDYLLKELIALVHPKAAKWPLRYYKKMPKGK